MVGVGNRLRNRHLVGTAALRTALVRGALRAPGNGTLVFAAVEVEGIDNALVLAGIEAPGGFAATGGFALAMGPGLAAPDAGALVAAF